MNPQTMCLFGAVETPPEGSILLEGDTDGDVLVTEGDVGTHVVIQEGT